MKTTKRLGRESWSPDQDSNQRPLECEAGVTTKINQSLKVPDDGARCVKLLFWTTGYWMLLTKEAPKFRSVILFFRRWTTSKRAI
jgi:hypothetical protein